MKERSIVGELINFRGLVYSPINEDGVIFLFGKISEDLNMYVQEIKKGFPDCKAVRYIGKGRWEEIRIEFEYKSKNFELHGHDPEKCDIVMCWEHNWAECPIEVLELKEIIKALPNEPRAEPDAISTETQHDIDELFKQYPKKIRVLFDTFDSFIQSLSEDIWSKPIARGATYYSPQRVFIYCIIQKQGLKLTLFTRGEDIDGVERTWKIAGEKWGGLLIRSEKDLEEAKKALRRSYSLIKEAFERNEPTGWYAPAEDNEDEI